MQNAKLIKDIKYGEVILDTKGNPKFPIAIIPKDIFDIDEQLNLDNENIHTRWVKQTNTVALLIYWPGHKDGFFLPFDKTQENIIKQIIKKKAIVIANATNSKKVLMLDVKNHFPIH